MRYLLVMIVLILFASPALAQLEDTIFYFGAMGNQPVTYEGLDSARLDSMENLLGFNIYAPWNAEGATIDQMGERFPIISDFSRLDPTNWAGYFKAAWAKVEAEDRDHEISFNGPMNEIDGFVYGPTDEPDTPSVFLDGLWFGISPSDGSYRFSLRLATDTLAIDSTEDVLGLMTLREGGWPTQEDGKIDTLYIMASDFFNAHQNILVMDFEYDFKASFCEVEVTTYQRAPLGVDYFEVSNAEGRDMVNIRRYISQLAEYSATSSLTQYVPFWYLHDEPVFTQWIPFRMLDSALAAQNPSRHGNAVFNTWMDQGYEDFIDIAKPPFVWTDPYPLRGGEAQIVTSYRWNDSCDSVLIAIDTTSEKMTEYTGSGTDGCVWYDINCHDGLQYSLNNVLVRELDSLFNAVSDTCRVWYTPQAMEFKNFSWTMVDSSACDSTEVDSTRHEFDSGTSWRYPTRCEFRCLTYMGMCYPIKGITYWKYDAYYNPPEPYWKCGYNQGIIKLEDGIYSPSHLWYEIHENINPYIKAIGRTFVGLSWRDAYNVYGDSILPPGVAFVSSISAVSNTSDPNPDLGWFQVGEFVDTTTGDKYVMIVNRACNQEDGTEAPAITATVRFSAGNLGIDCAYITDFAVGTDSSNWVGDTTITYSGAMPDGTIPFTTTLRAGEGRLYKITEAPPLRLMGEVENDTIFAYQGGMSLLGDITIPSGGVFRVLGPAYFKISKCDSTHSGLSSSLIEIINNGRLSFVGAEGDSIFLWDMYTCGTLAEQEPPYPGDWYGIRDRSAGYDTLLYCSIKYAYDGFRADTNSNALIRNCRIANSENNGVYLNRCILSLATVDSSRLHDNGKSGIYSYLSRFTSRGNTIVDNTTYGIYYYTNLSISSCTIVGDLIDKGSTGADYGIKIEGSSYGGIRPIVNISGTQASGFDVAGIYLNYSGSGSDGMVFSGDNLVTGNFVYGLYCSNSSPWLYSFDGTCDNYNVFTSNGSYGIYCANTSSPRIKECYFEDNSYANVACVTSSAPNLGDETFHGLNDFVTNRYDINNTTGTKVKARGNWWGEDPTDTTNFYPIGSVDFKESIDDPCEGDPGRGRLATDANLPVVYFLSQNYPNPFNPSTNIAFDLPEASFVRLSVFNILGQRIRTMACGDYPAGSHTLRWDGRSDEGGEVSSGIYFYLLEAGDFRASKKMLMVR